MNRIVIVGNGFDLSHGLKTSYGDFLLDYLKKSMKESRNHPNSVYEDKLIKIECNSQNNFFESIESLEDLFDNPNFKVPKKNPFYVSGQTEVVYPYKLSYKADFFKTLMTDRNWTDIESTYFRELIKHTVDNDDYNPDFIKTFHDAFGELSEKLRIYMEDINHELNAGLSYPKIHVIDNCFEQVTDNNFEHFFGNETEVTQNIEKVLFLNFNYTKLLSRYLENSFVANSTNCGLLHIHGELKTHNDMIFGYGDDTHPKYKELELLNDDELLSRMKSFQYPTNEAFKHLINFIETNFFDVIVMGHSLGISDRVLLKQIFETDKCKMITVLHRYDNKNDFRKWIPLSRHFDKKILMRRKIKTFEDQDVL